MGIRTLLACLFLVICACVASPVSSSTTPLATTPPGGSTPATTFPPTTAVEPTTTIPTDSIAIDPGPLTARDGHSVIWTGEEMIVWGGENGSDGTRLADGAAFAPVSGTWRLIAASPLTPLVVHTAAWTGEEMLVVGGRGEVAGAAYDPVSDTWRVIADSPISNHSASSYDMAVGSVWTGQELVVWDISNNQVVAFSPDLNSWRDLPSIDMPGDTATLRWTGDDLYAFTGARGSRLNQEGGWEPLPDKDVGPADPRLTAWAGDRFVAWTDAGVDGTTISYSPADGRWTETEPIPIPPCEGQGEPIQTGETFVAPGWCGSNLAILDPATDSWTTAAVVGLPFARHTVWTGTELLNWGGVCCDTIDAWRYPLTD